MRDFLKNLGIEEKNLGCSDGEWFGNGEELVSYSPSNGEAIATIIRGNEADYERCVTTAAKAFEKWRMVPAPLRGEIIRQYAVALRDHKKDLGKLVSYEMGKVLSEGEGEVQEAIDIADFAVGLSRQLYGNTMHSERPGHRMYEQWHPLGVVGIITAFNFPCAVWAWNSMIAAICGDTMIWKPSAQTPLTAIAMQKIADQVFGDNGHEGVMTLCAGNRNAVGEKMIADPRVPLISATGSCAMGRRIGQVVAGRLGRSLLELGGNNAIILEADANLDLALPGIVFGSVGTAGQRCTSTRRLFIERPIFDKVCDRLVAAYKTVRIGDPLAPDTLMGPLIDDGAVDTMMRALEEIKEQGGEIIYGGKKLDRAGSYVEPTLVKASPDMKIVQDETFAPILYLFPYDDAEEAIAMQNRVPQGLSSAIFTTNLVTAETFLSHRGSDCGIANVNIGTSGAEIGGAFGGEKDTGGGREAGSDSWKAYMRRQTNTINWSSDLPLAQGVKFDI